MSPKLTSINKYKKFNLTSLCTFRWSYTCRHSHPTWSLGGWMNGDEQNWKKLVTGNWASARRRLPNEKGGHRSMTIMSILCKILNLILMLYHMAWSRDCRHYKRIDRETRRTRAAGQAEAFFQEKTVKKVLMLRGGGGILPWTSRDSSRTHKKAKRWDTGCIWYERWSKKRDGMWVCSMTVPDTMIIPFEDPHGHYSYHLHIHWVPQPKPTKHSCREREREQQLRGASWNACMAKWTTVMKSETDSEWGKARDLASLSRVRSLDWSSVSGGDGPVSKGRTWGAGGRRQMQV